MVAQLVPLIQLVLLMRHDGQPAPSILVASRPTIMFSLHVQRVAPEATSFRPVDLITRLLQADRSPEPCNRRDGVSHDRFTSTCPDTTDRGKGFMHHQQIRAPDS